MLKRLIRNKLGGVEAHLGVPGCLDYVRHILDTSFGAFLRFAKIQGFADYRKTLPVTAFRVARLVAVRSADCGSCVQIEVNEARREGVPTDVLEAVVQARPEALPGDLAAVYRFAEGVSTASGAEDTERDGLRERYGEQGLVELAFAIAGSRIFATTKRALGYATSCTRVEIDV